MVSCWLLDLLLANRCQRNDYIQDSWSRTPPKMSSQTICKAKRDGAVDASVALSFQARPVQSGWRMRAGHSVTEGSQMAKTLCCPPGDVRDKEKISGLTRRGQNQNPSGLGSTLPLHLLTGLCLPINSDISGLGKRCSVVPSPAAKAKNNI